MAKIRSAPLAGIQDQAVLNALRMMQENIESLAGSQNDKAVPVTEEKFSKQIGALNETIAALRKQVQAQSITARQVGSSGASVLDDHLKYNETIGVLKTSDAVAIENYLAVTSGIQTDGWIVAAVAVAGGVNLLDEIHRVQANLDRFSETVNAYMAAHP